MAAMYSHAVFIDIHTKLYIYTYIQPTCSYNLTQVYINIQPTCSYKPTNMIYMFFEFFHHGFFREISHKDKAEWSSDNRPLVGLEPLDDLDERLERRPRERPGLKFTFFVDEWDDWISSYC